VGQGDHIADRVDRAERVGHVSDGDELLSVREPVVRIEVEFAAVVIGMTRSWAPVCSQSSCQGTMLEWCSMVGDNLVAGGDIRGAKGLGDEVDRLGGAADEDDLAGVGGVDEAADGFARRFVGFRRADAQGVHAAVDVGVVVLVVGRIASITLCGFWVVAALSR
jgi:hypothetical protein